MIGPSTPYLIALTVSAGIAAALAVYTWRRRPAPGAAAFALFMLAVAEWSLVSALRMNSADLPTKVFWAQVRYVGIVIVPAAWLVFALQYTGRERWLKPHTVALLVLEPAALLLLVWTNDVHHLVWTEVHLDFSGGFPGWGATHGVGYWLHAIYSYLLVAIGALLLIQVIIRTPRTHLYRRQISALLIGALAPVIGNTISALWNPLPYLDLTPIGFIIAGLCAAWGLYRTRLFDLVPVARDAVVESMGDGVIVLDRQGRVVDLNPAAERYLAVSARQSIGAAVADLGIAGLRTALTAAQNVAGPVLQEIAAPGGRTLYASLSPVRDVGWVAVMQDITRLKELDRLHTEWVTAVSHDMKSPLAAIQVSANLLEVAGSLTPEQREILEMARTSIARLRLLVTEVLDLALLEAQPLLQASPVNLRAVIATALDEVRPLLADRQHTLAADLPPELPAVQGDASQLARVLVNLLDNAMKYTPTGGRITVRARPQDGAVQVEVSDTGRGIPAEAQPHLFDRFYRVPGEEEESAGAGLGLSIVKTIVEKHGGRVWVESAPGQGSTFGFTIPTGAGAGH